MKTEEESCPFDDWMSLPNVSSFTHDDDFYHIFCSSEQFAQTESRCSTHEALRAIFLTHHSLLWRTWRVRAWCLMVLQAIYWVRIAIAPNVFNWLKRIYSCSYTSIRWLPSPFCSPLLSSHLLSSPLISSPLFSSPLLSSPLLSSPLLSSCLLIAHNHFVQWMMLTKRITSRSSKEWRIKSNAPFTRSTFTYLHQREHFWQLHL